MKTVCVLLVLLGLYQGCNAAIAASAFSISAPATVAVTACADLAITFGLTFTNDDANAAADVMALKLGFSATDALPSPAAAITVAGTAVPTAIAMATPAVETGFTANVQYGSIADCGSMGFLCAVVTPGDSFQCIDLTAKDCTACPTGISAGDLTVTGPTLTDIKYTCSAATTITFSLVIAEATGTAGSLTGINLYFTDNAQYETANIVKSTAVAATVSGTPKVITATSGITVTGATAIFTLDSTNCAKYTYLCAVITVASDTAGVATDDDTCILLSATAAGITDCSDTACPADKNGGTTTSPGSSLLVLPLVISAIYGVITY